MKILVVDDSLTMRKIIKNCLAKMGEKDVIEASDGVEALKQLENNQIDLILTDWNMPNMNGLEFLIKVRENEKYKNIPVIMVTTEAEKSSVIEAIKAGANNYVVKPFTPKVLEEKIKATMEKFKK